MTQSQKSTTRAFEDKAQTAIPDYVFVYHHRGEHAEIRFENVTIKTPLEDKVLIENLSFTLSQGQRAGLTGPNGGGKSSMFRNITELVSSGKGRIHITLPEGKRVFTASQEMRRPPSTLPGLMSYPNDPATYTHAQYEQAMDEAGLSSFKKHLPWHAVKSDVLFPLYKDALDNELQKYTRDLSAESLKAIEKALLKGLEKEIDVPATLSDYFDADREDALREKIIAYVQETLAQIKTTESGKNMIFPGRLGRMIARNTLAGGANNIQDWLRHGNNLRMSGGEEQKLGFARMFLQIDEVGFFLLDEVTAALKQDTAYELFEKLIEKAGGTPMIAIIHNNALLKHFTHHLEMDDQKHVAFHDLDEEKPEHAPGLS